PLAIEWSDATRFMRGEPQALARGTTVEVKGHLVAPDRLRADSIEFRNDVGDRVEIVGAVTLEERQPDGSTRLVVLGVPAVASAEVPLRGSELTRRLDQRIPDKQLTVSLLGRPLVVGGEFETGLRLLGNFDLDPSTDDGEIRLEPILTIRLSYF